ncbi:hypothetical protein QJS66_21935 [Kocuria rhizophila]|nr:hypothetical protein QJS66_21935 [Kocuria rhizophila]
MLIVGVILVAAGGVVRRAERLGAAGRPVRLPGAHPVDRGDRSGADLRGDAPTRRALTIARTPSWPCP